MAFKRFDPPANMPDFDDTPGQLQAWSDAVSGWIDESIQSELDTFAQFKISQPCQFFNESKVTPSGARLEQPIIWNGFPKTLREAYGQAKAYVQADRLFSLASPRPGLPTSTPFYVGEIWQTLFYRPQDEYCEWHVERDPQSGKILAITFTSEPPEYWQGMHGDTLQNIDGTEFKYRFPGNPKRLLELYREFVNPGIELDELICPADFISIDPDTGKGSVVYQKGAYNPYNKWNSTHGIMHLGQPNNTISAEIKLAADATVLRKQLVGGVERPVTVPDALVCCAGYGGPARNSDPTIGGTVNALALLGPYLTLRNPIGLYMNDLNTQGWTKPNGEAIAPDEYFRILRGRAGEIERAELRVPASEGFAVSDIRIAGVPIRYGGQVAEHINIQLTGVAVGLGSFSNQAVPCQTKCCIAADGGSALTRVIPLDTPCNPGYVDAFQHGEGTFDCSCADAATTGKGRK